MRQQQQAPTDNYQYNQVSPSRSPNAPTYTQLSGNSRAQQHPNYHPSSANQANSGMWGWQNQTDQGTVANDGSLVSHPPVPVVTSAPNTNATNNSGELTEMLTMLDQSGPASFEDLNINMFSTQFE